MDYLVHQLLATSAAKYPDRTAVVDRDRSIAYADLEGRANQLARLLIGLGVRRGDRVGFYLDKSLESMVAIYGILKAGAVYVPFDPQAPAARLAYIAADAGITHLLTGSEKSEEWAKLVAHGAPLESIVVLNSHEVDATSVPDGVVGLTAGDIEAEAVAPVDVEAVHLDLAYILYTSGSTGRPKGVMLSHLNALAFVEWTVETFEIAAGDRLSSHAPLHFDLSIFDVFAAAKAGAAVVIVPPETSVFPLEVAAFIEASEITVWYSVPSILSLLTQRGGLRTGAFPKLRTMLFAGEVFPTKYLRGLMELLPDVRFYNLYGPTETNVCTYYEVPALPEDQTEPISIGRAIANVEVFAVTEEGRVAEQGEVGELWVRGSTVMRGYWGDAERTREALILNPFTGDLQDLVYRTGDLVRQLEDGNYQLLGRRDHQIKSRGYRIELGEIETALYAHPSVAECAVVAIPDETVTNKIKAYVVVRDGVGQADLVRFCSERIPRYMIPDSFELAEALPKTSTGKIDRQALGSEAPSADGLTPPVRNPA